MVTRGRGTTAVQGFQGLIQLLLALGSAAGAVILIGEAPSFRVLIVIAALAGVTGALLTPSSAKMRSGRYHFDLASLLFNTLIGLGVGGGGFLIASSLLVGRVVTGSSSALISPGGTAAFGLLVGVVAGRAARFVAVTLDSVSGKAGTLGTLGAAVGYVDSSIQERLFGPKLINFNGIIVAEWYPAREFSGALASPADGRLIIGHVRIQINGGATGPQRILSRTGGAQASGPSTEDSPPPTASAHAILRIDGGEPANDALFTIKLRNYMGDVFPARTDIIAPIRGSSDVGEFTFLRVPEEGELQGPTAPTAEASSALIDISQAGTTVQLLELPLSLGSEGRSSSP